MGFGAVLCLWFPALLTTPELRQVYDMTLMRALIKTTLVLAFVLGAASLLLKRRKALGLTGMGLSVLATLMGGSAVEVATPIGPSDYLGLDWFLLNVLVLAMLFVPIEQLFAQWPGRRSPGRLDHGPRVLRGEPSGGSGHGAPHARARGGLLPLDGEPASTELARRPAGGLAILRDPPDRRPHAVRRPPTLSPGAPALALSRHSPLEPPPRLVGRLAPAPGRHRRHARGGLRAGLRPRLRGGPHLCLSRLRLVSGRADPRQLAHRLGSLARMFALPAFTTGSTTRKTRRWTWVLRCTCP